MRKPVFCFALFLQFFYLSAQDSLILKSPKKATIMSAVVPGLGQIYTKNIWKVPFIYAAGAALIYGIKFNYNGYTDFRDAYNAEIDDDPNTINAYAGSSWDASALSLFRDAYRRNLDLSVIGLSLLYIANLIDANVSAHLYYFKINKELELSWYPEINNDMALLKLKLNF